MTRERRIWGPDVRQDVDDELAFHLEERQRELEAKGMSRTESRDAALRRFGDVHTVAHACRAIDEQWYREQRRANMWMDLRQDTAYAVRSLFKAPGFSVVAALTLALGIGATTAIFSVLYGVLLRALPYSDASRLVFLWSTTSEVAREPLTPGRLVDFRERLTTVQQMAGISQIPFNLTGAGDPERLAGSSVSSSFFDVLGVKPLVGDTFHAGRAADRDVVLSYGLWVRRFGSDRSIVGRTIMLNGTARTVLGVMPPEFDWPAVTPFAPAEGPVLWVPGISRDVPRTPVDRPDQDLAANRVSGYIRAVARLEDGVTLAQAQHEAEIVAAQLAKEYPNEDGGRGAVLVPLRTQFFGGVRQPMLILLGAAAFVLAIAGANVASLLLGRGASRRGEIAVRLTLGASRGRIIRQLLTESVMLALAGGALGAVLAWWARKYLVTLSPAGMPRLDAGGIDLAILAFTLALTITVGVLFGTAPALQAAAGNAAADLNEAGTRGTGGRRTGRIRDLLAASQLGVALVLLVGATLLLRSLAALANVDTGIDTRNLLTFELALSGPRAEYQSRQVAFYEAVLREIRALPGVTAAGAAVTLPIGGDDFAAPVHVEGQPVPAPGQEARVGYQVVMPGYFDAMGIALIEGRDVNSSDVRTSQPVVLVNERFARQYWPGASAIGRRLRLGGPDRPWWTVVGVVGDIRHLGPATPPRAEIYQPNSQHSFPFMAFVVRTHADPADSVASIRAAIARVDPAQPISRLATMNEHIARVLARPRIITTLVAAFGAVALVLALVGTYGVTAYSVAQRTREIAIRSALGADQSSIMRAVLRRVIVVAGCGAAAGLVLAIPIVRLLGGLLYGVHPLDLPTFAAVLTLLLATAVAAGALPARRAARVSPVDALRG